MSKTALQQEIQTYLQQNLPQYLNMLRHMVKINSFTNNPAGVNALGELTARIFTGLGFTAETIQADKPDCGKHLILTRPGKSGRKIGLISHLDTVFPAAEEIRNNFVWREEGERIYGPGTVDIKGGTIMIYMILATLQKFAPEIYDDITWLVLLDAVEEQGGFDFGQICVERLTEGGLAALVFEGGRRQDKTFSIVAARKGMAIYQITAHGRAAHAGSSHARGANAIVQIADTIQRIAALTDYERELTFNVGVVSGGTVTNRVPHYAEVHVEMRTFSAEVFADGVNSMLALNGQSTIHSPEDNYPCQVNVELVRQVAPWSPNPESDRLLAIWQEAAKTLDMLAEREKRGGLSDGNHIWQQIPTIDGLGPSGGNAHCSERAEDGSKDQEYINLDSLIPKTLLNITAILQLIEAN